MLGFRLTVYGLGVGPHSNPKIESFVLREGSA